MREHNTSFRGQSAGYAAVLNVAAAAPRRRASSSNDPVEGSGIRA